MLTAKQRKGLELMATGEYTQTQIAEMVNVAKQTVSNWKKDDEFMAAYDKIVRVSIQSLSAKAYRTMSDLLDAKSEMVRYMVAKDVLDRNGFKPEDKTVVSVDLEDRKPLADLLRIGGTEDGSPDDGIPGDPVETV